MTIPSEERRALHWTREFLLRILTRRVTRELRDEAKRCLRHYPFTARIDDYFRNDPKSKEFPWGLEDILGNSPER